MKYINVNRYNKSVLIHSEVYKSKHIINIFCYRVKYVNVNRYKKPTKKTRNSIKKKNNKPVLLRREVCQYTLM